MFCVSLQFLPIRVRSSCINSIQKVRPQNTCAPWNQHVTFWFYFKVYRMKTSVKKCKLILPALLFNRTLMTDHDRVLWRWLRYHVTRQRRPLRSVKLAPGANASPANRAPAAINAPLPSWLNRCELVQSNSSLFWRRRSRGEGATGRPCSNLGRCRWSGKLRAAAAASPTFTYSRKQSMKESRFVKTTMSTDLNY